MSLRTGPCAVNDYFSIRLPGGPIEKCVGASWRPVLEFNRFRPREVVESSKNKRLGTVVLVAMAIYVVVLAVATVDDLAGWHLLRPLFGG